MVSARRVLWPLMVSASRLLWLSMVSVTPLIRWSTAAIACTVPSVRVVVSRPRRESIDWIAWVAPSVSCVASVPRWPSMVSVTDLARLSKVTSSVLMRPSIVSSSDCRRPSNEPILLASEESNDDSLSFSEASRLVTRLPSVVSNCSRRWSSEAVISPLLVVTRWSKVST